MKCCDNCLFIVEYIPVSFYTDRVPIFTSTRRNNKRGDDLLFLLSKFFFFSLTEQKTQVRFSDKKKISVVFQIFILFSEIIWSPSTRRETKLLRVKGTLN